ncbi:MAG: ATP-dependent Clp protease ATP-binding subunit [Patescibacteria group bacterium]|jgi:ATP-dependent Clp protease ATP-binding subunit ClpC|nr:ATP-dependent Clp protease ATP-binding subunit [Patescibacteria group bacterium]
MAITKPIVFTKNSKNINAASLKNIVDKKLFIFLLEVFIIAGFLSAIAIISSFYIDTGISSLNFFFRVILFIGLFSLPILFFIKKYFREIEDKILLSPEAESFNIYEISDLELVAKLGKLDSSPNSLNNFFQSIIRSKRVGFVLKEMRINSDQIQMLLSSITQISDADILEKVFSEAIDLALNQKEPRLTSANIFYGLVKVSVSKDEILRELELNDGDFANIVVWSNLLFDKFDYPKTIQEKMKASSAGMAQGWASGYTLNLDKYSSDITSSGSFSDLSVAGREDTLYQIENALTKEQKDNCILVGESGVGKKSIVYGLAEKLYWGKTLSELRYRRVVSLDVPALLAGAKDSSEISVRMLSILKEASVAGNIILFIDGIEKLFIGNTGKVGTANVEDVILPYLQGSKIKVIGTTTKENYQTYITPKSQISANFEKIDIAPMDQNQTMKILQDLSLYYSNKYKLEISYNALKEVYSLAEKFISEKEFPGKAVDMLSSICSAARNSGSKVLDKNTIDLIEGKSLNIPIASAQDQEKEVLLNLEEKLHQRVIGQLEAVKAVSDALRRARTNVTNNKRPIGTFLFLGPTGVGKTELSKALAWSYFDNEDALVRMDMNEYQSVSSIDRFIGKKVPETNELEGGEFVKKVREKPFSVVLLDELEKAHPDILNLFLQMLDEGYITDGMGKKVNMTNSIIIATSNAGANLIREGVGQGKDLNLLKTELLDYLQSENIYRPEFLNRFDGVIIFRPLTKEELLQITKLMFVSLTNNLKERGYSIEIDDEAINYLIEAGYKPESGAREIRRVMQDRVESFLAKLILANKINKGETYKITLSDLTGS